MKETKEALLAAVVLGKFVADRLKDGAQLDDAMALGQALMADGKFKEIVLAGYKDYQLIDDEFKNFGMVQAFELVQILPELVKVLKGEQA